MPGRVSNRIDTIHIWLWNWLQLRNHISFEKFSTALSYVSFDFDVLKWGQFTDHPASMQEKASTRAPLIHNYMKSVLQKLQSHKIFVALLWSEHLEDFWVSQAGGNTSCGRKQTPGVVKTDGRKSNAQQQLKTETSRTEILLSAVANDAGRQWEEVERTPPGCLSLAAQALQLIGRHKTLHRASREPSHKNIQRKYFKTNSH